MKGTRHNGRSGKNGVYNPLHNDRRFNPEHSEHIDNERVRQNIYWDCYQGYTTMEDKGKENNFSFEQIELAFYEEHYGNYVMKQNERHSDDENPITLKSDFILSLCDLIIGGKLLKQILVGQGKIAQAKINFLLLPIMILPLFSNSENQAIWIINSLFNLTRSLL